MRKNSHVKEMTFLKIDRKFNARHTGRGKNKEMVRRYILNFTQWSPLRRRCVKIRSPEVFVRDNDDILCTEG